MALIVVLAPKTSCKDYVDNFCPDCGVASHTIRNVVFREERVGAVASEEDDQRTNGERNEIAMGD